VNGSSSNLSLFLGAGAFQTVQIGSNKASVDNIGNVDIFGSGTIQSFISDAAATTPQEFDIDSVGAFLQQVTRVKSQGEIATILNTFTLSIKDPNQLYLTAGKGGDEFNINGTQANTTTSITGGAGQDSVYIATNYLTPPVLGPLYFSGNASQGDNATFYAEDSVTPAQAFILQATPSIPNKPNVDDLQGDRIAHAQPTVRRLQFRFHPGRSRQRSAHRE
jgi:hypothetical protein